MRIAICALALLLFATACGGGGGGSQTTPTPDVKAMLQSVKDADLAMMVLPQDAFGPDASSLQVDNSSGFQDNDKAADGTLDPSDTGADLANAGRLNGYELQFSDPAFAALEKGAGLLDVDTSVELFKDAASASKFVAKQTDDLHRFTGKQIGGGATLEQAGTFPVSGLGDEAIGYTGSLSFGGKTAYLTFVGFRSDRLLGSASIGAGDSADVKARVEALARALYQRVQDVAAGKVSGTPVPLPTPTPSPASSASAAGPDHPPYPDQMALSLDDLPQGATVDQEGYVKDDRAESVYQREFSLPSATIGGSQFLKVESDVRLYTTEDDATFEFQVSDALFGSDSGQKLLASAAAKGAGFQVSDVKIEPMADPHAGDDSAAARMSMTTPVGPFDTYFYYVRVGRAVGTLMAMGLTDKVSPDDAAPLAQAMAERMRVGLAPTP